MSTPINLDTVSNFTGKLNKQEKSIAKAGLESGKSFGSILDEIAISRMNVSIDNKRQDQLNSKIKNYCSSKAQLNLKVDSQTNERNHWEQRELQKDKIRDITNQVINLQKKKRKKNTK